MQVVTSPLAFVLLNTPTVLMTVGLLVVAAALLCIASLASLRSRRLQQRRVWQQRLNDACREAKTIVDLTTPADAVNEPLTTVELRSLADRVSRLDGRMAQLAGMTSDGRLVEAIADVRHVAISLGAALNAERSLRLESGIDVPSHRVESLARILHRSAELDLAATEMLWRVDTAS